MTASKFLLTATAATLTLAGALGLSHAQTTTPTSPGNSTGPMTMPAKPDPATTTTPTMPTNPSMEMQRPSTTPTPQANPAPVTTYPDATVKPQPSAAVTTERAARADRN